MQYLIQTTESFDNWFRKLKERSTKTRVLARLARIENGNFGDHKQIATNLYELRFFFGAGFRIYYTIKNEQLVLLLQGGDKSSQVKDIEKARQLLNKLENNHETE